MPTSTIASKQSVLDGICSAKYSAVKSPPNLSETTEACVKK